MASRDRLVGEAGIKLADKPGPLYQLLVLATLLSVRIAADIASAAALITAATTSARRPATAA